jgi:c-di-GMP-binding flagellar brake protein YcgR
MLDKRRYKRFTLNDLEVNGRMIAATEMKVVDISISGISLKVNRRLNIGSEYSLKLEGGTSVSLRGIVVWCSLIETRKISDREMMTIYSAGLQFKNMSAEKTTELLNFIEAHKVEEVHVVGGARLHVRFHINDPKKAILNFSAGYTVKTISLGGMLIECVQDLEIESRVPMELFIHIDKPVEFVGRVASCHVIDSDGQKQYSIGIEFLNLTEEDREVLASFIDYTALIDKEIGNEAETAADKSAGENIPVISREFIDEVEYLYKWHKTMGYYKMLGIKEYATDEQIKHAFLTKTRDFHPDKFPGVSDDLKQKLNELFSYFNAARSTLLDPKKRKEYDRTPITRIRH